MGLEGEGGGKGDRREEEEGAPLTTPHPPCTSGQGDHIPEEHGDGV